MPERRRTYWTLGIFASVLLGGLALGFAPLPVLLAALGFALFHLAGRGKWPRT